MYSAGWFSADNLLFPGQPFGRPLQINVFPLIVEMSRSASISRMVAQILSLPSSALRNGMGWKLEVAARS